MKTRWTTKDRELLATAHIILDEPLIDPAAIARGIVNEGLAEPIASTEAAQIFAGMCREEHDRAEDECAKKRQYRALAAALALALVVLLLSEIGGRS